MSIWITAPLVAAVYAAAGAALVFGGRPRKGTGQHTLMNIDTSTIKGKRRFMEEVAKLGRKAAAEGRDPIL